MTLVFLWLVCFLTLVCICLCLYFRLLKVPLGVNLLVYIFLCVWFVSYLFFFDSSNHLVLAKPLPEDIYVTPQISLWLNWLDSALMFHCQVLTILDSSNCWVLPNLTIDNSPDSRVLPLKFFGLLRLITFRFYKGPSICTFSTVSISSHSFILIKP